MALLKRAIFRSTARNGSKIRTNSLLFDSIELDAEEAEKDEKGTNRIHPLTDDDPSQNRVGAEVECVAYFPEFLPRVQRIQELDEADIPEHLRGQEGRRFQNESWRMARMGAASIASRRRVSLKPWRSITQTRPKTEMVVGLRENPEFYRVFAGPSLLASIGVSRFADHLPYYRFEEILQRSGITIDRATQCRWMISIAFVLVFAD